MSEEVIRKRIGYVVGPKGDRGDPGPKGDTGDPAPTSEVAPAVTSWMDEHITENPTVVIDNSLSVSGAAADAKAVGDEISDLKSALDRVPSSTTFDYTFLSEGRINADGSVGTRSDTLYTIRPCDALVNFELKTRYYAEVAVAFYRDDMSLITPYISAIAGNHDYGIINIPEDAAYYGVNCANNENGIAYFSLTEYYNITSVQKQIDTIVDNTLTQTGKAADAKKTGDKINNLEYIVNRLPASNTYDYTLLSEGRIITDGSVSQRSDTLYTIRPCDVLVNIELKTRFYDSIAVAFYNANMEKISVISAVAGNHDYGVIDFPEEAAYYGINCANNNDGKSYFSLTENSNLMSFQKEIVFENTLDYTVLSEGRIVTDGSVYTRSDTLYAIRPCKAISEIILKTRFYDTVAVAFYTQNMTFISYIPAVSGNTNYGSLPIPQNAYYYGVNCANNNDGKEFFMLYEKGNLIEQNGIEINELKSAVQEADNAIVQQNKNYEGSHLVLPSKMVGVVGEPLYCYHENVLDAGWLKDYTVVSNTSKTDEECSKIVPASAGESTLNLYVYKGENKIRTGAMTIKAVAKLQSSKSAKVLVIGDSKTQAAGKMKKLKELIDADNNMGITFIGTRGNGTTVPKNEGYSGQSIITICQNASFGGVTNPFYNSSLSTTNKFDFAYYTQNLGDVPDIVFIDFGMNQVSQAWSNVKDCYDFVIDSIHSVSSSIKIVICIQESKGLAYKPTYIRGTKMSYGYNSVSTWYTIGKMIAEYENRENEKIYICPQYLAVDLYKDFPLASLPVNECNSMEELFCMDEIHAGNNAGSWINSANYVYGSYVNDLGMAYAAKKANTNIQPSTDNGEYWSKIINPDAGYNKIAYMYYYLLTYMLT